MRNKIKELENTLDDNRNNFGEYYRTTDRLYATLAKYDKHVFDEENLRVIVRDKDKRIVDNSIILPVIRGLSFLPPVGTVFSIATYTGNYVCRIYDIAIVITAYSPPDEFAILPQKISTNISIEEISK
jgi:hypothetical protein